MKYKIITAPYEKATLLANQLQVLLQSHERVETNFEYLFLIGGDATFAQQVREHAFITNLKIIGINGGNIGFFSMFNEANLKEILNIIEPTSIDQLCYKTCHLIQLKFNNKIFYAFNDLVIFAKGLLTLDIEIDKTFFEHYRGSGLLLSTKYGSTGYNKSALGPIIFPEVQAWLLHELFPQATSQIHSIRNSIILPLKSVINLKPSDNYRKFRISLDGVELAGELNLETLEICLVQSEALFFFACDSNTYIKKLRSIFLA